MWWPAFTKGLLQAADGDTMLAGHAQVQPRPSDVFKSMLTLSGHGLAGQQQQRYGRSTAWAKVMLRHAVSGHIVTCEASGSVQRQLLEYGRPGWEYHAKGIWCVPAARVSAKHQVVWLHWGQGVASVAGTILSGADVPACC